MSAAGRGSKRRDADYYPTPYEDAIKPFLDENPPLLPGLWLEPCVGDGAIVRGVERHITGVTWDTCDIRPDCGYPGADICDFLVVPAPPRPIYDVCMTNPPFTLGLQFVQHALRFARRVAMLLRVGFVETKERSDWLRANPFDVYMLSKRPSFTGGGTDASHYGWFVSPGEGRLVVCKHRGGRRSH